MKSIVTLALITATSHAAVLLDDVDLQSAQQSTTVWTNLTSSNAALAADSGAGTFAVNAPGYPASFGIYSYAADYSVNVTQTATFDIHSVVLQIECTPNGEFAWPYAGGPLLTIATGSGDVDLAASYFSPGASEVRNTFGEQTYTAYAWQWDLSGYGDTITSVSINTPVSVHSSITAARIDVGDSYLQAIPEPSAALLSALGVLGILRRRRA